MTSLVLVYVMMTTKHTLCKLLHVLVLVFLKMTTKRTLHKTLHLFLYTLPMHSFVCAYVYKQLLLSIDVCAY